VLLVRAADAGRRAAGDVSRRAPDVVRACAARRQGVPAAQSAICRRGGHRAVLSAQRVTCSQVATTSRLLRTSVSLLCAEFEQQ